MEDKSRDLGIGTKSLVAMLIDEFHLINGKLDMIVSQLKQLPKAEKPVGEKAVRYPDAMALLQLPSSLRKTVQILYELEQATADELSARSSRKRAVECAAANQLVRMGYLKKKRLGRDVYFFIESSGVKE